MKIVLLDKWGCNSVGLEFRSDKAAVAGSSPAIPTILKGSL